MNLEGYNAIRAALYQEHIEAAVSPEPKPGDDSEYVTVITHPSTIPACVLNALGKAGLMRAGQTEELGWFEGPKLEPVFGQPGSITFRDTNNGY